MDSKNTTTAPSKVLTKELGYSGTIIFSGLISSEEYNRDLTGVRANQKYEIMRRSDSTIRSVLRLVKLPILSTTWDVKAVKQEDGSVLPEDEEKANFVKRELMQRNINFYLLLKQALTSFDFGFSVFEKVYEPTEFNGKYRIGLSKIASRKQVSITNWEMDGGKPGIKQLTRSGQAAEIPRNKLVIFTNDREGDNYEGISLLRYVYKDWDIKDKLTIVNAMALERHGMGIPIATAREGQTPSAQDQRDVEEILRNIRANQESYLKSPSTYDIAMMDMQGSTTREIIPTLQYHDRRISQSMLAQFTDLGGSSGSGSQSLSEDLTSLFMKSEESVAKEIVATITDDIIKQLCDINYADMSSGYPQLEYGTIGDDDDSALAESLSKLMTAGAVTADAEIEDNLRGRLRLPLMSKEAKDNYEANKEKNKTPAVEPGKLKLPKDTKAAIRAAQAYRNQLIGMLAEG